MNQYDVYRGNKAVALKRDPVLYYCWKVGLDFIRVKTKQIYAECVKRPDFIFYIILAIRVLQCFSMTNRKT